MKILEYTFRHLNGFGDIKEKELKKRKIFNWSDFERSQNHQLNFDFAEEISLLKESKNRLENEDIDFFVERLPGNMHFLIPHSFPEKTLFLDIETTGLSQYYDSITIVGWSVLNSYDVYISGDEEGEKRLAKAIESAKAVVTFNGSIFDLPFIRRTFPSVNLPNCHVDLRFFSKRAGYTGGQKKIENLLQIARPDDFKDIDGFEATLLWFKYKEGDLDALEKLIKYNVLDIDGMKYIFEKITSDVVEKEDLGIDTSKICEFSNFNSEIHISKLDSPKGIKIRHYTGKKGPAFTVEKLSDVTGKKIVGIDLTGSEKKATGWSLLENNIATTKTIYSDNDLIAETIKHRPEIISIDSPLSIPTGRTSFFDDDPMRNQFGITRECERTMAKRGIKSYPCLIPSMQKLTQRGMQLAEKFRELGYEVIESYPGAAQDIMGIPRKGKSLEFLIKGLQEFGINGDFDKPGVTHDEIDAITSAIVGHFYLANKFEALGNENEGYLIVPKIN